MMGLPERGGGPRWIQTNSVGTQPNQIWQNTCTCSMNTQSHWIPYGDHVHTKINRFMEETKREEVNAKTEHLSLALSHSLISDLIIKCLMNMLLIQILNGPCRSFISCYLRLLDFTLAHRNSELTSCRVSVRELTASNIEQTSVC